MTKSIGHLTAFVRHTNAGINLVNKLFGSINPDNYSTYILNAL